MTEPDLAALRRRLEKAQEQNEAKLWRGSHVPTPERLLLADALALLSLVARLQGERDSARAALRRLQTCGTESAPCWCEEEWLVLDEGHAAYCRAARAALGEEADG